MRNAIPPKNLVLWINKKSLITLGTSVPCVRLVRQDGKWMASPVKDSGYIIFVRDTDIKDVDVWPDEVPLRIVDTQRNVGFCEIVP